MSFVYWRLLHVSLHIFFCVSIAPCSLLVSFSVFFSFCLLTPNTILFCFPPQAPLCSGVYCILCWFTLWRDAVANIWEAVASLYCIFICMWVSCLALASCSNLLLTASPDVGNLGATWHCIMMRPAMLHSTFYSVTPCSVLLSGLGCFGVAQIKF